MPLSTATLCNKHGPKPSSYLTCHCAPQPCATTMALKPATLCNTMAQRPATLCNPPLTAQSVSQVYESGICSTFCTTSGTTSGTPGTHQFYFQLLATLCHTSMCNAFMCFSCTNVPCTSGTPGTPGETSSCQPILQVHLVLAYLVIPHEYFIFFS